MDGNGRWAEAQGLPRFEGHRAGAEAVRGIVKACSAKHISVLSLFAFGQENWARPAEEVGCLMDLLFEFLERELEALYQEGVRLRFLGEREALDDVLQTLIQTSESLTKNNTTLNLNIMFNYSGRWDLLGAMRGLANRVRSGALLPDDISESVIADALVTCGLPEPDMLIRTSGEQRISNFFLWQLAYSELYFTNVAWPEFTPDEFDKALAWFASRERRYGKTSRQMIEEENA